MEIEYGERLVHKITANINIMIVKIYALLLLDLRNHYSVQSSAGERYKMTDHLQPEPQLKKMKKKRVYKTKKTTTILTSINARLMSVQSI